jgi:hypothetical protein
MLSPGSCESPLSAVRVHMYSCRDRVRGFSYFSPGLVRAHRQLSESAYLVTMILSEAHQQNVFSMLEVSRSVWEDVECKLRCINFRTVSDPKRAFRLAFEATEISVGWRRSAKGVIVISLGTPWSTGENFVWCTWDHLQVLATSLDAPVTSLGAPRITVEQSGKNIIFFGNAASAPGNYNYYLLSNDC